MPKILVVDDEIHILELVRFNLEKEGYQVIVTTDGLAAVQQVLSERPDLLVLDIMLPKMDGLEVCRTLRSNPQFGDLPIIMLTAKGEERDTVMGLEMGADDYIKKPFSPRELVARVKARLRTKTARGDRPSLASGILSVQDVVVDTERFEVLVDGQRREFTPKEFELLRLLMANPGRVFTRDVLLENIWGYEFLGDTRTVDVHIRHLRQKLGDDPAFPRYIETIRGIGYRFKEQANV